MSYDLKTTFSGECVICYQPLFKSTSDWGFNMFHDNKVHALHSRCSDLWKPILEDFLNVEEKKAFKFECKWCHIEKDQQVKGMRIPNVKRAFPKNNTNNNSPEKVNKSDSFTQDKVPLIYNEQVLEAAHLKNAETVEKLLKSGVITNNVCGEAVIIATKNQDYSTLKKLCLERKNQWEHIPEKDLDKAIVIAESNKDEKILDLLRPIQERNSFSEMIDTQKVYVSRYPRDNY